MTKSETARGERADILSFELRHSFVIRHSGFAAYKPPKTRESKFHVLRGFVIVSAFFEMKHRRLEPLQYDDRKMLTILFLGDIVGEPGRTAVIARVPKLKEKYGLDFIVVNGENAAGGRGITGKITIDLLRAGVSVITTGDHVWDQKEILGFIDTEPRLLRPVNYPDGAPGSGSIVLETTKGKVGVINVQARTFMQPILENPFHSVDAAVAKMRSETTTIIVDVHGETTSEKIALGRFLDGKVSAVIGTHTHVQTADEQIFPGGTAFLCDAGMCGPINSILGRAVDPIMNRFISNLPASFPVAGGEVRLRGALIEIDESTGRAVRITRVDEPGPGVTASSEPEPKIDLEQAPSPEQT
jgi:2',3'-cyclic-nucleotide 2'-phosphodiesterase